MNDTIRIRAIRTAAPPDDARRTAERWQFLERLGIEGALAHWMMENLTESQFSSLDAFNRSTSKQQPGVAAKAKAKAKPSATIVAACERAVSKRPHVQAAKLGISQREMGKCRARGIDPARYAAIKAASKGGK